MINFHIKTSIRLLKRFFSLSIITIFGLMIGFTCILLLSVWVNHELNFDKFYDKVDRIYKVFIEEKINGHESKNTWVSFPLSKALKDEIPEIENSTIVTGGSIKVKYNNIIFYENRACFAEAGIFDVFDLDFVRGDKEHALKTKESIVITEKIAEKYFGTDNPIGKLFQVNDDYIFKVSAVIKNIPENSSINYDLFVLAEYFSAPLINNDTNWGALNFNCYVCLTKNANPESVRGKIKDISIKHNPDQNRIVNIQSIQRSHFYSVAGFPTNITNIRIMIALGIVIFLVAFINFLHIAFGQHFNRITEFKTKGILGANYKQVINQVFAECFVINLVSLVLSFFLCVLLLPIINGVTGMEYSIKLLFRSFSLVSISSSFAISLILSTIFLVIFSMGSLRFSFGNQLQSSKSIFNYRAIFVIIQYAVSIVLVIGVLVVVKQLNYIMGKNTGLETSDVITLPLKGNDREKYPVLKMELSKNSHVKHVTAAYNWPNQIGTSCPIKAWPGNNYQDKLEVKYTVVDEDYFSTMGMTIIQGVPFSKKLKSDSVAYIINESAVKKMNLKNPVGAMIDFSCWTTGKIIGVVKDFHLESMRSKIRPLLIANHLWGAQQLLIKFKHTPDQVALSQVETIWKKVNPQSPFSYQLMDNTTKNMYRNESRFKNLMFICSTIAIILSAIGIFGIILIQTQKRTKEIGIRKVNGAKIIEILIMLNASFIYWIVIAFIVVCPIGWYFMTKWLENFAYKTELSWWIFALAGGVTLLIALITVSCQSWRAANRNPVEALRYE